jgi:hypothetical protein
MERGITHGYFVDLAAGCSFVAPLPEGFFFALDYYRHATGLLMWIRAGPSVMEARDFVD